MIELDFFFFFLKQRQASLFIINKRDLSSKYKSVTLRAREKRKIQSTTTTKAKKTYSKEKGSS